MWSRRVERINELLLQDISQFVLQRQDPDIGLITFTGVKVTEDLMEAKVFYSVLGTEENRARAAQVLHSLKWELRRSMRHLESLRRIPDFVFIYDESPEQAARVFEILDKIHDEDQPSIPLPEIPVAKKTRSRETRPNKRRQKK